MSFHKRDTLRSIEKDVQKEVSDAKLFEVDAGSPEQRKFMATFPFPYANGRGHLGHSFAFSKAEFATRFHRMQGEKSLLPFGYHCTGMPIKASADKLKAEIEEFGFPPQFPTEEDEEHAPQATADVAKSNSKKSKTIQKTGGAKRQYEILLASGVSQDEIQKFVDSGYWLEYFPPLFQADLNLFGAAVDHRRSFITTDVNPYFDAFVQWQYRRLQAEGYLKFGKRHTIYSPKDGQGCADHDRASGEGVVPQEYTLIKMQALQPLPKALAAIPGNRKIFFAAATLRPETMYGQTCVYIKPEGTYGAFAVDDKPDGDVFVTTKRAATNMAFQGLSPAEGKVECLATFTGMDMIGCAVKAPLATYDKVYMLPMESIKMNKGTGVVTSVPSDSPDDYATLRDIKKKPEYYLDKYGVTPEMIVPYDPVEIIETTKFGRMSAAKACEIYKIVSRNDAAKLAIAKEEVYKAGFYDGVFLVGKYKGEKVETAKGKVRDELLASGEACVYWEPQGVVISRSGEECVVALTDQWYVDYALPEWKAKVRDHVNTMETYNDELKQLLLQNVERLHEWGCSRSFGLGTKLPADPKYLIESLSDSTIYMAYYTIAHMLQGGNISPEKVVVGSLGIAPEQCTDALFDFVFSGKGDPATAVPGVDAEKLLAMRKEFTFWYPWDLRTSGRDLAYNHLVFSVFHHVALFEKEQWPRSIQCCAFLQVDGEKMSKSRGNFMTLEDAIERFTCDGTRITLADGGDSIDVANFDQTVANNAILRLYQLVETAKDIVAMEDAGDDEAWDAQVFEQQQRALVADTMSAYDRMLFRDVVKHSFYVFFSMRERYVHMCEMHGIAPSRAVMLASIERQILLLSPITPHVSEHIWRHVLKRDGFAADQRMPTYAHADIDFTLVAAAAHLDTQLANVRKSLDTFLRPRKGQKGPVDPPKSLEITLCKEFPAWQKYVLELAQSKFNEATKEFADDTVSVIQSDPALQELLAAAFPPQEGGKKGKKKKSPALMFFGALRPMVAERGADALATTLPYDEEELLHKALPLIKSEHNVEVTITISDEGSPGNPSFRFSH